MHLQKKSTSFVAFKCMLLTFLCLVDPTKGVTYGELRKLITSTLECHVCNPMVQSCPSKSNTTIMKCDENYFKEIYGTYDDSTDLGHIPTAFSEKKTTSDPKWHYGGFPELYKLPSSIKPSPAPPPPGANTSTSSNTAKRISGLAILWQAGKEPKRNQEEYFKDGYKTCMKMRISTTVAQRNGGLTREIPDNEPRIIQGCSFRKDTGCNIFNYKTLKVEVCYCKDKATMKNGVLTACNDSSNLRISHLIVFASLFIVMAQFAMKKV